jgi:adenosylcobinamide-GDP ribazoletransferase
MDVLKVFRDLMSFLTTISPTKDESFIETSARFMFLFPLIGALIGFLAGLYSLFAYNFLSLLFGFLNSAFFSGSQTPFFFYLAKVFASVVTLAFLFVITGLQHLDGLVDLGNALGIQKASVEEKIRIAHAWTVTRTGALLAISVSFCTLVFLFLVKPEATIQSLIVAETSAKLAMVTCAWQGSSLRKGLGSIFVVSMKKRHGLYLIALVFSMFIGISLSGLQGVLAVTLGTTVGGLMVVSSKRIFGGVTGDVFGATNEIGRMISLFALVW